MSRTKMVLLLLGVAMFVWLVAVNVYGYVNIDLWVGYGFYNLMRIWCPCLQIANFGLVIGNLNSPCGIIKLVHPSVTAANSDRISSSTSIAIRGAGTNVGKLQVATKENLKDRLRGNEVNLSLYHFHPDRVNVVMMLRVRMLCFGCSALDVDAADAADAATFGTTGAH